MHNDGGDEKYLGGGFEKYPGGEDEKYPDGGDEKYPNGENEKCIGDGDEECLDSRQVVEGRINRIYREIGVGCERKARLQNEFEYLA